MGKINVHVTGAFLNANEEDVFTYTWTCFTNNTPTNGSGQVIIQNPQSLSATNSGIAESARLTAGDSEEEDRVVVSGGVTSFQ